MNVRRNVLELSTEERKDVVDALLALKKRGRYDDFVREHVQAMNLPTPGRGERPDPLRRNAAHRGPAFLTWHREYLRRFELELQVPLPYWDWTIDAELTDPTGSELWSPELMGGNGSENDGWAVIDGPFAYQGGDWKIATDLHGPALRRRFASHADTLPTKDDVDLVKLETVYDSAPWDLSSHSRGFRNRLEGWIADPTSETEGPQLHNRVHAWVGELMNGEGSPNDPVFFLHHSFIDKIWADWQFMQKARDPGGAPYYLPRSGGPAGHNLDDEIFPWNEQTNRAVLDHVALGYRYDTDVVSSPKLVADIQRDWDQKVLASLPRQTSAYDAA